MCAKVFDRYGGADVLFEERESPDDAGIKLIYQRQVLMPFGVLDFVDPDGINLTDRAVLQVEHDDMFDSIDDLIPGGAERLGRFLPRKPTRSAGEEHQIGLGQRAFAVAPRDFFDDRGAAAAAVHSPHGVQEEDTPETNRHFRASHGCTDIPFRASLQPERRLAPSGVSES
jgi:hypothetical protein